MADIPHKVFLVHDGKILLIHAPNSRWQPPGGRLDVGEQPEEAFRREMREELGIEIEPQGILHTFVFTSASGLAHYAVVSTAILTGSPDDLKPDPKEISEIRWCGQDDFENLDMHDGYKEALRKYFHARAS